MRTRALGLAGVFLFVVCPVRAHVELEQYLQQRVTAIVTPANVDITLELLFTSPVSREERHKIDADLDGVLSGDEVKDYLDAVASEAERGITLRIDGIPLPLIPLHDAELDFLDSSGVEAHPHVLRLFFFARTPESFHTGSTLSLDSTLWTDAPSLVASTVYGENGIEMNGAPNPGLRRPSELTKSLRVVTATCKTVKGKASPGEGVIPAGDSVPELRTESHNERRVQ
ncbi:MAG: hypothetical protein AMXMBFR82_20510 [Candidatus Hydrogenedentota bacterium]